MHNYARLSIFAILSLVALRVCIGWHFYMEGVSKVQSGGFASEGFLNAARGPLADDFQGLIWDHDGKIRLNQERVNGEFEKATQQAIAHFSFTDQQKRELGRVKSRYFGQDSRKRWIGKLNEAYKEADEEIFKYWESEDRIARMEDSPTWNEVSSLRGQMESIERDRMAGVQPTLVAVDAIWRQYEARLNSLATPEQLASAGYFRIERPGEGVVSSRLADQVIPIFDMAVGILLIIGLLTPLAAWAAALFLVSVILTQMPGYPGTEPTYYQAIECIACIVLATSDAGRFAGLDFIPWAWWKNKKAAATQAAAAAT